MTDVYWQSYTLVFQTSILNFILQWKNLKLIVMTFQCSFWTTMKWVYILSIATINYISMERLWNGLFGKNYFVYAWSNRKPNEAGQLERDNVSLSELIAYKTSGQLPSWWPGWSSKPCGDFLIFLLDALQLVCQVCCSKFYQYS